MNYTTSFAAALILSSCAVVAPASKPALRAPDVLEVDFSEISEGQPAPYSGVILTDEKADAMIKGLRRIVRDAELKVIDAGAQVDVFKLQLNAALEQVRQGETDRAWALAAKIGVGGLAIGAVVVAVSLIFTALK